MCTRACASAREAKSAQDKAVAPETVLAPTEALYLHYFNSVPVQTLLHTSQLFGCKTVRTKGHNTVHLVDKLAVYLRRAADQQTKASRLSRAVPRTNKPRRDL